MSTSVEDLYRAEVGAIHRHCLALLGNAEDAAEATQEAFSRLLREPVQPDNPGAWLHRVAHNHCVNRLRSRRREARELHAGSLTPCCAGADPERQALARMALRRAFATLTPREQRALVGSAVEDRSIGSVARDLGMTYMGAAQLLSRARRRAAAAAGTVLGLGAMLAARRAVRSRVHAPAGPPLSGMRQNAAMAVATVLVAGAAVGFSRPHALASPPHSAAQSVVSTSAAPTVAATPAHAGARATAQPRLQPASSTDTAARVGTAQRTSGVAASSASTSTPAPVTVKGGPYRCGVDPSSPLTIDCTH